MSEHWKSTPKYWCKHCGVFVRDTKLERQNHEATGRHQGALKRFLRDLHRGHEREEREKDRARREIERLNGVVGSGSGSGSGSGAGAGASGVKPQQSQPPSQPTTTQLAKQREQLAELGVAMPTEFRAEMALPGEWTVTNTRVIEDDQGNKGAKAEGKVEAKATGVRKREVNEDEKEEQEAVKGLFKKQKRWGGTRTMPQEDSELDALLNSDLLSAPPPKKEEEEDDKKVDTIVKKEEDADDPPSTVINEETGIKKKPIDEAAEGTLESLDKVAPAATTENTQVKTEESAETSIAPVMFKKRKPKNIRQK